MANTNTSDVTPNTYAYRSYIKDIFLEVPNYRYFHHPYEEGRKSIFIGRTKIKNTFLEILKESESNGVYLVTGYRGMGKTSFVNRVIEEYTKIEEDKHKIVKKIKISLAQSKLEEIDILKHIIKQLYDDSKEDFKEFSKVDDSFILPFSIIFSSLLFLLFFIKHKLFFSFSNWIDIIYSSNLSYLKLIDPLSLSAIFTFSGILTLLFQRQKRYKINKSIRTKFKRNYNCETVDFELFQKIENINERCNASISQENQGGGGIKDIFNFYEKKSKIYPIASTKEIEYEIIQILKSYTHKKIIFVFDELDKIEPENDKGIYLTPATDETVKTFLNDLRERKQIIIKVLSALKHLLTEAHARFIFIAGREMFDASLADISDRQSALGSIFHHTFYVESFLRENSTTAFPHRNALNTLVESYLEKILIPIDELKIIDNQWEYPDVPFLRKYTVYLNILKNNQALIGATKDSEIIKIIFVLQNFIYYLLYRSNGSPKKLSKLIEENFIIGLNHEGLGDNITTAKFYSGKLNIIISSQSKKSTENTFLNLSFKQQYKFSFNAYLFFPFLSVQNNFMGNYSDSILVSTPYLMDNIIKFHPFAFSIHNLELFPEILSTNKSPEIRFFIEELVRYLSNNHIRETEAGLFQYKFFDKIHNEISYISKISDEESAAFNFSLDESYSIKSHIAAKIKFVRTTFKEFKKKDSASIESLIFLNDVLGDSQIFDEYYDDAVISLSDALHDVPAPEFVLDINDNFIRSTSTEVFLLWMRIRLKLAMVFEKMKYQEMAMGHLGVAMDTATKYLKNLLTYSKAKKLSIPLYRELLQVTQQAILGSIYVQEKFAEGITFAKLESYLILYSEIHEHAYYKDYNGRDMLMANFYAQIGTILYYKNKTLPFRSTQKMIFNENGKAGEAEKDFLAIAISQIQETPVFRLGKNNQESNILDGASKEIPFYDFVSASYKEIYKFFNFNKDKRGQDFRFSFATFVTYKKSLATYLAIENIKGNQYTLQIIISDCIKILTEFRNVHNPRKLIAIGNLITKISDLLFSLYKAPLDDKTKKIDLNTINQIIIDYQNVNINGNKNIDLDDIIFKKTSKGYELFNWNPDHLSICYIALLYYLSGRFYLKAGRTVTFAFQLKKILLIFHTSNALNGDYTEIKKITDFFGKTILRNILETVSWTSNNSDRPQISTSKHYLGINDAAIQGDLTQTFYQHLSNNPDSKEAILLFLSLKMKLYPYSINWETIESFEKATNQITELKFISQTNSISHQSVRIMEHSLQLKINKLLLARVISNKLKFKLKFNKEEVDILLFNPETDTKISWEKNLFLYVLEYDTQTNTILENKSATFRKNTDFPNDPITPFFDEILKIKNDENKLIYFKHYTELITNSIFCLHQCIISSNLYGINYMQGYTYIASFHKKMGDWLKHYSLCKLLLIYIEKKEHEENKELRTILTVMQNDIYMLLGNVAMRNLEDPLSHYQTALQYYIKAIQMHSEGSPYKDQINNMIYMEDDYNDNLSHFGAAIERQIINSGKLRDTITQLSEELRYSKLYDYNNFI